MKLKQTSEADRSVLTFEHLQEWEDWLSRNHIYVPAVWLRPAKKCSQRRTLTYTEASETALVLDRHARKVREDTSIKLIRSDS